MATTTMTKDNVQELLDSNPITIVDFWAGWCGPCKRFGPIFEEASERHDDVLFAKVDTEAQGQLAGSFGIRSIPTVAIFREGILLFMQPGLLTGPAVDDLLKQVRELDMEEVKAKVASA